LTYTFTFDHIQSSILSMQYRNNNNDNNSDLVGSLEDFGLSKYEARAYLTMLGRGSLAASEI
jgi:hypothetical protein